MCFGTLDDGWCLAETLCICAKEAIGNPKKQITKHMDNLLLTKIANLLLTKSCQHSVNSYVTENQFCFRELYQKIHF